MINIASGGVLAVKLNVAVVSGIFAGATVASLFASIQHSNACAGSCPSCQC
jgi:hypothetical protein